MTWLRDGASSMLTKLASFFWTKPKTMETSVVRLPPDLPNWPLVKELLQELQGRLISENISDQETCWFMQTVHNTIQSERRWSSTRDSLLSKLKSQIQSNAQKKLDHSCVWFGLLKFLRKVSREERDKFLYTILPNVIEFALGIEDCRLGEPLHISRQQHGGSVKLPRLFVCSIVACFFLCLFPERKREGSIMNSINFTAFFRHLPLSSQVAKLRCVLHYFECMMEKGTWIQGNIVFCRKVAPAGWMLTFDELLHCDLKLCPLHVHSEGAVEDSGPDALQVCFGNKSVGGGVLGRSVVQEEIMFSTCPELMAAMLFMENMETNEAILVSGFHRFSSYSGYGDSLEFTGHYSGSNQIQTMVTIDAASYRETSMSKQFEEASIIRDLNKALIGFSWAPGTDGAKLQSRDIYKKDDESPGAVDVAADIVTSAMTDALRQAAESPVDPEVQQPPAHPVLHSDSQSCHLPHSLSGGQCAQQDPSCKGTGHLQDVDAIRIFSSAGELAAETAHMEQTSSYSSVTYSGSFQTAQSRDSTACHPSSSVGSSGVGAPAARASQPLLSASSMPAASATTSTFCPDILVDSSDSKYVQRHEMVALPDEKCQAPARHSAAVEHLRHYSSEASSVSDKASGNQSNLAAAEKFSAFVRASELLPSLQAHSASEETLTYDVLGNLSRINTSSSTRVFGKTREAGEQHDVLHSTGQHEMSQLPEANAELPRPDTAEVVTDIVITLPVTSPAVAVSYPQSSCVDIENTQREPAFSQGIKSLTDDKFEMFNSLDVVVSLSVLQTEYGITSSGRSSSSLAVNVDSQSVSTNSAEEESTKQLTTEALYINVDNSELPVGTWSHSRDKSDGRSSSIDSVLLEPPLSSSPQSSVSSANVSPNTSFLVSEPFRPEHPNRSGDVHAVADFFIPALDSLGGQARQSSRRESRDCFGEVRDFLSSSSSGSRGSGSAGPVSSANSSWGSRSGSLSSHGTNGSTIDFPEFWSNFRRRSSQLSDTTSRRSSSSKHSSDFSTDLEEIAEGMPRHDHGVIEEEGNLLSLVADFAANFVFVAVRNGVTKAAQMTALEKQHKEEHWNRLQLHTDPLNSDRVDQDQVNKDSELLDMDTADRDLSSEMSLHHQEKHLEAAAAPDLSSSSALGSKGYGLIEPQAGCSSPTRSSSKHLRASGQDSAMTTSVQGGVQPSASHSIDSGFSSGKSSITFRSECKTLESLSEETSASPCTTNTQGLHLEAVAGYLTADNTRSSLIMPASLFPGKLDFTGSSEPTADKANIPLSPTHETLYAVLESKTVFLEPEKVPKPASMEQMQFDPADSGTNIAFIPLHPAQKTEASHLAEYVEHKVHISRKKLKHQKNSSAVTVDVPRHELKHFRRQKAKDETSDDVDPWYQENARMVVETEAETVICGSPQQTTPHPVSGVVAPGKSSGIPKLRDKRFSCSESSVQARSKNLPSQKHSSVTAKEKQKDMKKDRALKEGTSPHSKLNTNTALFKSHRSRYVFSDVAAPLADTRKSKTLTETLTKKKSDRKSLKKQDEKRRKQHGDSTSHDPARLARSQKFIRFVNSLAERSVSQAVLEAAEILVQRSTGHRSISDELYNWFATRIVAEVFQHVIGEVDTQQSSLSQPHENDAALNNTCAALSDTAAALSDTAAALSDTAAALSDTGASELKEDHTASKLDLTRDEAAALKPKSILPAKSDVPESKVLNQIKLCGSLKMVKFKDSQREDDSSLSLPHPPALVAASTSTKSIATSTFHRQSSSIPIPIRRKSSLDLPLSSSASPPGANGLTSAKLQLKSASSQQKSASGSCAASLTSRDLSIDVYQAAAAIVSQVLQAVSDSLDAQAVSPVSSGWHGTLSSSDTAIHSTGSRFNGTYDSLASNIFSSSSPKTSDSPRRARRSVSPSIGIFSRKPMSRETLTNAFLKVDSTHSFKTYERRSSEPCQTSVQLSLQAFNSIKFSRQAVEDKQRKISRTDDDIGRGKTWRRGSLDGFSFERRNSCGFKDPVLSRFAEELMKADTSVPELVIVGSQANSSSTGSRRSSICAFREYGQGNFDCELLNTSFTSVCSLPVSHSSRSQGRQMNMDRSHSRDSRNWKSDSSDTEYWFPPPKIVGDEFQQEYNRQHSQEELQDYASFFAGRVVQEAVCVLKCDPEYMSKDELDVELFAENLMDQIMRDALMASIQASRSVGLHMSDQGGGGDGAQNHSATTEDCVVNGDNGDAQQKGYHAEGARPKTSHASFRGRPKTKSVPQRSDARRRGSELDDQRGEDGSDTSRDMNDQRMRRAVTVGGYEACQSRQYLRVAPPPGATNLDNSRQRSTHRQSVHNNSADNLPPSSKHKRHSSSGPTPHSSVLLPSLPPSAHAASASHLVQAGTSQCEDYPQDRNVQMARSSCESLSSAASSIPGYRASTEHSHLSPKPHREESCASSASSVSSYHSEHTGSSLPSSSGSEGIGPTGKDTHPRKHRTKRESEYRNKTSPKSDYMKLSSAHKERSRQREPHSRRADAGNNKRRTARDRRNPPEMSEEQRIAVDQFAASLSLSILDDALLCCRDDRWLRFLSYQKPIATGNWGCGAYRGNAQLKLVIQWIAASVSHAPSLVYYTFNDERLLQAEEVVRIISGQTVGQLAAALQDYCHWVCQNQASSSSLSPSARPRSYHQSLYQANMAYSAWKSEHESCLPLSLFDFLLEKFKSQRDR